MRKKIKVVIDTNIFISALLGSKNCKEIRDKFVEAVFDIVISEEMFGELMDAIREPKFENLIKDEDIKELRELLEKDAFWIIPEEKVFICRDIEDNIVLECALAGKVDFIVTGDKDLLSLKKFKSILIITPKKFIKLLR
jgi:putative PIN family toxin of toxin-antitoxin system